MKPSSIKPDEVKVEVTPGSSGPSARQGCRLPDPHRLGMENQSNGLLTK